MKVLVTGGTGFIGGNLIKRLIKDGYEVRALVLADDPGKEELGKLGSEIAIGDLRDLDSLRKATKGVEKVFNCAAVVTDWAPKSLFDDVNIKGMENILQASVENKVSRFIDVSTNDVFGVVEDVVIDETFPLKEWNEPYADTKIEAEKIAWKYYREFNLPVTMVYPCWAYGPGDKTFIPLTADAIIKHQMMFWRKDVIVWPSYVDNIADLLLLISEKDEAVGNGYLVHDGESTTFQEFCKMIADTLGEKAPSLTIPYWSAIFLAKLMELIWRVFRIKSRPLLTTYTVKNLGSRMNFSIEKAKRELGWSPPISFAEGFKRSMEWLKTKDMTLLKQK